MAVKYTTIPPLYSFGDSLSDTGRLQRKTLGLLPPPPYFNGRLSNGPVAIEYLAQSLGISFRQANNYAIAGANSGRDNINDNLLLKLDGFLDQIDSFTNNAAKNGADPNGIYVVWIGANDLFNGADTPAKTIKTVIRDLNSGVSDLTHAGARHITIATSPNLGRTPFAQDRDTPASETTALVNRFNTRLKSAIATWQTKLPNANLMLADVYPLGEAIATDPATYGFTNTETGYIKDWRPVDPKANADEFFFWDQVHPTTRAHSLYAEVFEAAIINGITDGVAWKGTAASDRLVGYAGHDRLKGGDGDDVLLGNAGNDKLLGGPGDDWLDGGDGRNNLRGGQGADRFVVRTDSQDKILDFKMGEDQLILSEDLQPTDLEFKTARIGVKAQWVVDGSNLAILRGVTLEAIASVPQSEIFSVA